MVKAQETSYSLVLDDLPIRKMDAKNSLEWPSIGHHTRLIIPRNRVVNGYTNCYRRSGEEPREVIEFILTQAPSDLPSSGPKGRNRIDVCGQFPTDLADKLSELPSE